MPTVPFADHADLIQAVLAYVARGHRLTPDAADEFSSWAHLKLLGDDRAILRKFKGQSSLRTYLVTVIQRLYLDWRVHEWGKWRPSSSDATMTAERSDVQLSSESFGPKPFRSTGSPPPITMI